MSCLGIAGRFIVSNSGSAQALGAVLVHSDGGAREAMAFLVGPIDEAGANFESVQDPRLWPPGGDRVYRIEASQTSCLLRVTVRVKLNWVQPPPQLLAQYRFPSSAQQNTLKQSWKQTTETKWSDLFLISRTSGGCAANHYRVLVRIAFVNSGEHILVNVHNRQYDQSVGGAGTEGSRLWFFDTTAAVAAHEFGHMLGYPDEYAGNIYGVPVTNDNGIMQTSGGLPRPRNYSPFAVWLSETSGCNYAVPQDPWCIQEYYGCTPPN